MGIRTGGCGEGRPRWLIARMKPPNCLRCRGRREESELA